MWASKETMEAHRLVGGSTSWLLVSWIKRPLPLQLWFDIHHQGRKNRDCSSTSHQHIFSFFPFCLPFFSLSYNRHNLFYNTRLGLWNNRRRLITFPWEIVFCQREEKGKASNDKRKVASVKGQPLWSYCRSFRLLKKKRLLYFITFRWNLTYFSEWSQRNKSC